ncbi:hypothetical protein [Sphingomonas sp.]|uniref:hypothetical protein n=1 Tax=Sphingomonas sp. TaxID=28214 RepID=UPI003CC58F07
MRAGRMAIRAALAVAAGLCVMAAAPAARAPAPRLLLPVSDADSMLVGGSGCESAFAQEVTSWTFMRNTSFMLRTGPGRAGLHQCTFTDAQAEGFGEGGKALSCGGRRVSVRRVGRVTSHAEADSSDYPAVLTVTDGRRTETIRGSYGTAC